MSSHDDKARKLSRDNYLTNWRTVKSYQRRVLGNLLIGRSGFGRLKPSTPSVFLSKRINCLPLSFNDSRIKILELVDIEVPQCFDTERANVKAFLDLPVLRMDVADHVQRSRGAAVLYDKPKLILGCLSNEAAVDAYCILGIEHPLCRFNLP